MQPYIQVIHKESEEALFKCPLSDQEKAFEFAKEMEALGIEVTIISPPVTETLARSLGVPEEDLEEYNDSVREEMENHP